MKVNALKRNRNTASLFYQCTTGTMSSDQLVCARMHIRYIRSAGLSCRVKPDRVRHAEKKVSNSQEKNVKEKKSKLEPGRFNLKQRNSSRD